MNCNWNRDMSDDYILMQKVMDDGCVTVKQLVFNTGMSERAIYKYRSGELTIPSVIWRVLYTITNDHRIQELFCGGNFLMIPLKHKSQRPDYKKLINARKSQLKCEEFICQILADGVVDESDADAIKNYKRCFHKAMNDAVALYQSIVEEYPTSNISREA